jgi:DNA-binding HxlR family transcriptional regulator
MLTKDELPFCPVVKTLSLIGNKWKMLILRNLLAAPQRFSDFMDTIPGISKKVLTDNLRELERDGIISREVFDEFPPKVIYSLTELGESLRPIIDAMRQWGNDYRERTEGNIDKT